MPGTTRLVLTLAVLFVPTGLAAQGKASAGEEGEIERAVARIREATKAFHDVDAAVAAGYPATDHCLESATGAMGHHFVNRTLYDAKLEVERPEILVYAPWEDGGLELAGVEYVVPYSVRPRDAQPPTILGQELKRADGLQIWYLHVWVWKENPKGLFTDWNPTFSCRR